MAEIIDVAIVGAGPYGLSLAAQLKALGVNHRIFGKPMDAWRRHMPEGMLLKSDGFASNLCDREDLYTLARFCRDSGIEYDDERIPVPVDIFARYGLAFQARFVPYIEDKLLESLQRRDEAFVLRFDDGSQVTARRVVIAVGIGHFRYIPKALAALPAPYLSHSYDHHELAPLLGQRVVVLGGGASAIDLAALLKNRGCDVQLVCRRTTLRFGGVPGREKKSFWQAVRSPRSGLGPGWRSRLCTDAPLLFHALPTRLRLEIVRRHLGPAASGRMREMFSKVPVQTHHELTAASVKNGEIELSLCASDRSPIAIVADRVIAATGYRTDLRRLPFLGADLLDQMDSVDRAPVLSTNFESSIEGLYFVGAAAAASFGPLMRFAFGARFAARRLANVLARDSSATRAARSRGSETSAASAGSSP